MKERDKRLLISGISGAVGGAFGAVSGSNSWIVVACVAGFISLLVAWLIHGMIK